MNTLDSPLLPRSEGMLIPKDGPIRNQADSHAAALVERPEIPRGTAE